MDIFAYVMAGLFVLMWVVLLIKFISVVSAGKQKTDKLVKQDDVDFVTNEWFRKTAGRQPCRPDIGRGSEASAKAVTTRRTYQ